MHSTKNSSGSSVSHSQFQLVRHKVGKHHFEVACHPGVVLKWRKQEAAWSDVPLVDDAVFADFKRAERARGEDLQAAFETEDLDKCMQIICQKGEVSETSAERKEKLEKKRAEVVAYIHKYFVNPATSTPHPVTRIELALESLKIRVDPDTPAEKQAEDMRSKLVEAIPLKKSTMEGTLTIPHKHLGSTGGILHRYTERKGEKYTDQGCVMEVGVVPGDYDRLMSELHSATKGEFTFQIAGQSTLMASGNVADASASSSGKGKGGKGKKKK